jgi:thiamine pyrophosphate-dependent acetolactate synthase large subunit-like protein
VAGVAAGYGVSAAGVSGREELREALKTAIAFEGPSLVEVGVTPGMALF